MVQVVAYLVVNTLHHSGRGISEEERLHEHYVVAGQVHGVLGFAEVTVSRLLLAAARTRRPGQDLEARTSAAAAEVIDLRPESHLWEILP